jgi:hypothetical protein
LLEAYADREIAPGKRGPTRQISFARRSGDADNRNIDALFDAFASGYQMRSPRVTRRATS